MAELIPAILETDFKQIQSKLAVAEGLTEWVQLDVVDGLFSPQITWEEPARLAEVEGKVKLEAHLMIEQPENFLGEWSGVVDRIIVHQEATEKLGEILDVLAGSAVQAGVALLIDTPLAVLDAHIKKIDVVQLMGIAKIGVQGLPLDTRVLERVKTLRALYPNVTISVDGGVTLDNAEQLLSAGVNNFVVGSGIWKQADPVAAIKQFQALLA